MLSKFKKIIVRDDGYLQLHLKRIKDFDEYVYGKILEESQVIKCMKDPKSKVTFYYDLEGFVTLKNYLLYHSFDQDSLLAFLIDLYKNIVISKTMIPLLVDIEYVFIHEKEAKFYFIGLPIGYEVSKNDHQCITFTNQILQYIQSCQYDVIGYLYCCLKNENISFHKLLALLQKYHEIKEQKKPWYLKILKPKENYLISDIPKAPIYMRSLKEEKEECSLATMVLLSDSAYLEHVDSKKIYLLNKEKVLIGRSSESDITLLDIHVSNIHACYQQDTQSIEDLNSANGTFVNHVRIHKQVLNDLDQIRFANQEFIYHKESKEE